MMEWTGNFHPCRLKRDGKIERTGGNWAQCSHENTGLRAIVSNIEPKNVVVNVRRDFHKSPQLHIACHFSSKRRISNFHPFLDRFHSASAVSYKSCAPFEAWAQNSSTEADSVEHSPQLPTGEDRERVVHVTCFGRW
jgi:hypothetical protein